MPYPFQTTEVSLGIYRNMAWWPVVMAHGDRDPHCELTGLITMHSSPLYDTMSLSALDKAYAQALLKRPHQTTLIRAAIAVEMANRIEHGYGNGLLRRLTWPSNESCIDPKTLH